MATGAGGIDASGASAAVGGATGTVSGTAPAAGASLDTVLASGVNIGMACGGAGSTSGTAATDSAGVSGFGALAMVPLSFAGAGGVAAAGSGVAPVGAAAICGWLAAGA